MALSQAHLYVLLQRGRLLTDRRIEYYQLRGVYGTERRLAAERRVEKRVAQRVARLTALKRKQPSLDEYV